jgi:hypothetical protein
MQVTVSFKSGWHRESNVFETYKQVLASLGKLADEKPAHVDGYLAERPTTLQHCIRVWAPCGCCLTYMSAAASVLTECAAEGCNFEWHQAQEAIEALRRAEEAEKPPQKGVPSAKDGTSDSQLALVVRPKS